MICNNVTDPTGTARSSAAAHEWTMLAQRRDQESWHPSRTRFPRRTRTATSADGVLLPYLNAALSYNVSQRHLHPQN
ncbi:MAG TPA: hypothetical protein VFX33_00525 [Actinomycetales bacterium]|jgi:hypothetical protein|nr:hypothetical protein [Actinomycetales bacterium]